jgi:hypothetical protein
MKLEKFSTKISDIFILNIENSLNYINNIDSFDYMAQLSIHKLSLAFLVFLFG